MLANNLALSTLARLGGAGKAPAIAELFIFAGQSNAQVNVNTTLANVPAYIVSDPGVKIWDHATQAFVTYGAGTNSLQPNPNPNGVAGNWGAEAEFAYRMRQAFPAKTVYIVKYAVGSAQLLQSADGLTTTDWSPASAASEYFGIVEADVAAAKATLVALGKSPVVRVVSWMQGEQDAQLSGVATSSYQTNLSAFVTAARSRWSASSAKFLVGRIFTSWGSAADNTTIRAAQKAVCDADPTNVILLGQDASSNNGHFQPAGAVQFGDDQFLAYTAGNREFVSNGTFGVNTAGWAGQSSPDSGSTFVADGTCLSAVAGRLRITNSATATITGAIQAITGLTVGAQYRVEIDIVTTGNTARAYIGTDPSGMPGAFGHGGTVVFDTAQATTPTTFFTSFIAPAATLYIGLFDWSFNTSGFTEFDNISVIGP
jgi:hypothetical protein